MRSPVIYKDELCKDIKLTESLVTKIIQIKLCNLSRSYEDCCAEIMNNNIKYLHIFRYIQITVSTIALVDNSILHLIKYKIVSFNHRLSDLLIKCSVLHWYFLPEIPAYFPCPILTHTL